jgi:hypothetical protein
MGIPTMQRSILAVVVGLVTWFIVGTLLNLIVRHTIDGYAVAEHTLEFTLSMKLARLVLAALASLAAGVACRRVAPGDPRPAWVTGVLLLALFLPVHVGLWHRFPLWYHLTFLLTLIPLVLLGARLRGPRSAA